MKFSRNCITLRCDLDLYL